MWIDIFFEEWALVLERSLFHSIAKKVSKKFLKKISKKILKKDILASESGPWGEETVKEQGKKGGWIGAT